MSTNVIAHPAIERQRQEAHEKFAVVWQRYLRMKRQVDVIRDVAWTGLLVSNFTDDEIALFAHLISLHEHSLLKAASRRGGLPPGDES